MTARQLADRCRPLFGNAHLPRLSRTIFMVLGFWGGGKESTKRVEAMARLLFWAGRQAHRQKKPSNLAPWLSTGMP
jgi:hypothetical protein